MACTIKFSYSQLMGWWIAHGGPASVAPIAAAVGMAESGGCVDVVSPPNRDGSVDVGLWQINSKNAPPAQMVDPVANVNEAIKLSRGGTNWHPWTTFNTGAYHKYLAGGTPSSSFPAGLTPGATLDKFDLSRPFDPGAGLFGPFGQIGGAGSSNPLKGFSDVAKAITAFVALVMKPIEWANAAALWLSNPRSWERIALAGIGALVLGEGLHMLTGATPSPVKAAVNVVPVGRAASSARRTMRVEQARRATLVERQATTAAQHAERRRTIEHQHRQRRQTEEHRTEQQVTRAEAKASAARYRDHPGSSYTPGRDEERF